MKRFSLGGEPALTEAGGLLVLLPRIESWVLDALEMDPERFSAWPIFALSDLSAFQLPLSLSDDELLPLSVVGSFAACT